MQLCSLKKRFCELLTIALLLLLALMISCKDSSTGPNQKNNGSMETDGIWEGAFLFQPSQQMLPGFAYIDPNGEATICTYDTSEYSFILSGFGTLNEENGQITGSFIVFHNHSATPGGLTISEGKIVEIPIQGSTVRGMNAIFSGTATPLSGLGTLSLAALDTFYHSSGSLALIAGSWLLLEGTDTTTLQISSNGQVQGGNNLGAQFSGRVEVVDPERNLYRFSAFTITQTEFPLAGEYIGLTALMKNTLPVMLVKTDQSGGFYAAFSRW